MMLRNPGSAASPPHQDRSASSSAGRALRPAGSVVRPSQLYQCGTPNDVKDVTKRLLSAFHDNAGSNGGICVNNLNLLC